MLQNKNDFFCDRKVTLGTCFVRILFQHYTADLQTPDESRKDRAKIATLCLDGLSTAIHIVCHRFHDKLPEFLKDLGRLIHQLCRMTSFPPCLVFLESLCHKCKCKQVVSVDCWLKWIKVRNIIPHSNIWWHWIHNICLH